MRVDIGATVPNEPTDSSSSDDVFDSGSEVEQGGREANGEKEDLIQESAAVTATHKQMSLDPTTKPELEDISGIEGAAGQDRVQTTAVATASNVQFDVQRTEKVLTEAGVETRHETKEDESSVVANPVAAMSNVRTSSPALENTLGSEDQEEGEHEEKENSNPVRMNAALGNILM